MFLNGPWMDTNISLIWFGLVVQVCIGLLWFTLVYFVLAQQSLESCIQWTMDRQEKKKSFIWFGLVWYIQDEIEII